MGRPRAELQTGLEDICPNVYFQPPSNVQMEYPAIVYQRDTADVAYADNQAYLSKKQYQLLFITRNPDDNAIWEALANLPMCRHERFYVSDNLNHDVFTIFF